MNTAEDRERLISRAQELYKAVLAYTETLPDHYDMAFSEPALWADIRGSNVFIQIDEDVLCTAVSDVTTWTHRNLAMYLRALEMSAIGLGIIPPRAAEIQWSDKSKDPDPEIEFEGRKEWESECGYYIIVERRGRLEAIYEEADYARECHLGFFDDLAAAKQACQDHKQGRLEGLL